MFERLSDLDLSQLWRTELFSLGDRPVTLATLVATLLVVAVSFVVAKLAEKALIRAFRARGLADEGNAGVAGRLLYYTLAVIGLAVALNTLGFELSALFAAGAVFAVGIGFGLQNLVQNFVSGLTLLTERLIKPTDVLEIDGELVRIRDVGLRATVARTLDDEDVVIPNATLIQSNVKNLTFRDRLYRLRLPVGVAYDSDLDRVVEVLNEAALAVERRSLEREPVVLLTGFGSSSIDFEVSIWLSDPWEKRRRFSELALSVWRRFKEAGVVIAFPQVDVHFDDEALDRFRTSRASSSSSLPSAGSN